MKRRACPTFRAVSVVARRHRLGRCAIRAVRVHLRRHRSVATIDQLGAPIAPCRCHKPLHFRAAYRLSSSWRRRVGRLTLRHLAQGLCVVRNGTKLRFLRRERVRAKSRAAAAFWGDSSAKAVYFYIELPMGNAEFPVGRHWQRLCRRQATSLK
jgi:hypothetical protein